jgi:hypothetical protein
MKKKYAKYGLYAVGGILLTGLFYVLFGSIIEQKSKARTYPSNYKLAFPETITAGEEMCTPYLSWMQSCELIIENSWGIRLLSILDGASKVCLLDSVTQQTGLIDIYLNCNKQAIGRQSVMINPLAAAEPLEMYLGSKSITADGGIHWSMITAVPVDSLTNPVQSGTSVLFDLYRPNGEQKLIETSTEHLVAFHKIYSGFKTGKTIVGGRVNKALGQEKSLMEEPGYPTDFVIKSAGFYPYADNRQFSKIETSVITDKFGNKVADGTLINFLVTDVLSLKRRLNAYTIDGVAILNLQNPILPGEIVINAFVFSDVISNEIRLNFKETIKEIPVKFDRGKQVLIIGPLLGPLEQYIPDGSEIVVKIKPINKNFSVVLLNGYTKIKTADLPNGLYEIEMSFGGIKRNIKFRK